MGCGKIGGGTRAAAEEKARLWFISWREGDGWRRGMGSCGGGEARSGGAGRLEEITTLSSLPTAAFGGEGGAEALGEDERGLARHRKEFIGTAFFRPAGETLFGCCWCCNGGCV